MPNSVFLSRHGAALFAALAGFITLATPTERALGDKPASPVTVVNPATNPALTSSVDDPGRIAYQAFAEADITNGGGCTLGGCIFHLPVVPAGKRLVIQHVAVEANITSNATTSIVIIRNASGNLLSSFSVPVIRGSALGDQAVQFYVDGGGSFEVFVDDTLNVTPAIVEINLTGYLLDCTVNHCETLTP